MQYEQTLHQHSCHCVPADGIKLCHPKSPYISSPTHKPKFQSSRGMVHMTPAAAKLLGKQPNPSCDTSLNNQMLSTTGHMPCDKLPLKAPGTALSCTSPNSRRGMLSVRQATARPAVSLMTLLISVIAASHWLHGQCPEIRCAKAAGALGLLLGTQVSVMTPDGVDFSFLFISFHLFSVHFILFLSRSVPPGCCPDWPRGPSGSGPRSPAGGACWRPRPR